MNNTALCQIDLGNEFNEYMIFTTVWFKYNVVTNMYVNISVHIYLNSCD